MSFVDTYPSLALEESLRKGFNLGAVDAYTPRKSLQNMVAARARLSMI